ncbi:MAG TPA: hypothetical protein VLA15_03325, partial [Desulfurivibrionaceae bacterium]|nr:hypothetical protein [Desulfurivibrionaceae bacterium]
KDQGKDQPDAATKPQKEMTPLEKAEAEAKEIKERLAKDNQLRTALMILKGLTVYSEFKLGGANFPPTN